MHGNHNNQQTTECVNQSSSIQEGHKMSLFKKFSKVINLDHRNVNNSCHGYLCITIQVLNVIETGEGHKVSLVYMGDFYGLSYYMQILMLSCFSGQAKKWQSIVPYIKGTSFNPFCWPSYFSEYNLYTWMAWSLQRDIVTIKFHLREKRRKGSLLSLSYENKTTNEWIDIW